MSNNKKNTAAKEVFKTKYPNDDDDEINFRFNDFLSSMLQQYNLNQSDIERLCEMFKNNATFEQIAAKAEELYRIHQEQYAEACQQIADEKAGGVGEYHGFMGKNNPQRRNPSKELER